MDVMDVIYIFLFIREKKIKIFIYKLKKWHHKHHKHHIDIRSKNSGYYGEGIKYLFYFYKKGEKYKCWKMNFKKS
jgi:hypothetical protein